MHAVEVMRNNAPFPLHQPAAQWAWVQTNGMAQDRQVTTDMEAEIGHHAETDLRQEGAATLPVATMIELEVFPLLPQTLVLRLLGGKNAIALAVGQRMGPLTLPRTLRVFRLALPMSSTAVVHLHLREIEIEIVSVTATVATQTHTSPLTPIVHLPRLPPVGVVESMRIAILMLLVHRQQVGMAIVIATAAMAIRDAREAEVQRGAETRTGGTANGNETGSGTGAEKTPRGGRGYGIARGRCTDDEIMMLCALAMALTGVFDYGWSNAMQGTESREMAVALVLYC